MHNDLGWRFLLEPWNPGRLLWLETSDGTAAISVSRVAGEPFIMDCHHSDLLTVREALAEQRIGSVTFTQLGAHDNNLPFPGDQFDAVIMANGIHACLLPATSSARNAGSALHSLIAEVYRVVKRGGYVYVAQRNKYCYKRIMELLRRASHPDRDRYTSGDPSVRLLKDVMRVSGFNTIQIYKLLGSNGSIEEIVLGDQYGSAKNSFTFKQKLKERLLSSPFASVLAPSLGIVATKGTGRPRYLDLLIDELIRKEILWSRGDQQYVVKRYLILPGKVILSVGEVGSQYGEKIVVLPLNAAVLDRLRDEARTLQALHDATLRIQSVVPTFFTEGKLGGQEYLVQQEMPGTSVDAPVASLEVMTSRAVRLLIDFHCQTAHDVILDDKYFAILFSNPLSRVVERLGPTIASSIDRIEKIARSVLHGKRFKVAWMHGDFKIENLIFDPDSLQISGIIDWDLSRKHGYPLVDLLYLIAYNRLIRDGREIEEIILDCIIPQKFSDFEQDIRDKYMCALAISEDLVEMLTMMFCIHHLAYRRDIAGCTDKTIEDMHLVLGAAERMTQSKYGRR